MTKEEYEEEKKFVLSSLGNEGDRLFINRIVENLVKPFHDDKEVMLATLEFHSECGWQASERLFADRDFVMKAVTQSGFLLSQARHWNDDIEVVKNACTEPYAVQYASDRIKSTPELMAQCCDSSYSALNYLAESVKKDKAKFLCLLECLESRLPEHKHKPNWDSVKRKAVIFASSDIQELIGDGDPIPTLKSAILSEKLEAQLRTKPDRTKTMKI